MTEAIQSPPLRDSWIKRGKYEFGKADLSFFPVDCLGARGKEELADYPAIGKPITLVYSFSEWSGDIAARKGGVTRPRDHAAMKKLIGHAHIGDYVRLTELAPRRYKVELISSDHGGVISV